MPRTRRREKMMPPHQPREDFTHYMLFGGVQRLHLLSPTSWYWGNHPTLASQALITQQSCRRQAGLNKPLQALCSSGLEGSLRNPGFLRPGPLAFFGD